MHTLTSLSLSLFNKFATGIPIAFATTLAISFSSYVHATSPPPPLQHPPSEVFPANHKPELRNLLTIPPTQNHCQLLWGIFQLFLQIFNLSHSSTQTFSNPSLSFLFPSNSISTIVLHSTLKASLSFHRDCSLIGGVMRNSRMDSCEGQRKEKVSSMMSMVFSGGDVPCWVDCG